MRKKKETKGISIDGMTIEDALKEIAAIQQELIRLYILIHSDKSVHLN